MFRHRYLVNLHPSCLCSVYGSHRGPRPVIRPSTQCTASGSRDDPASHPACLLHRHQPRLPLSRRLGGLAATRADMAAAATLADASSQCSRQLPTVFGARHKRSVRIWTGPSGRVVHVDIVLVLMGPLSISYMCSTALLLRGDGSDGRRDRRAARAPAWQCQDCQPRAACHHVCVQGHEPIPARLHRALQRSQRPLPPRLQGG